MEDDFILLAYRDSAPTLAMCRRCEMKFFALRASHVKAEQYLRERFAAQNV